MSRMCYGTSFITFIWLSLSKGILTNSKLTNKHGNFYKKSKQF